MAMVSGFKGAVSQINVTPLIDVLLVLLIIFMVITPVTPRGLEAVAPQPAKTSTPEMIRPAEIVVEVLADGSGAASYRINSSDLAKTALEPTLAEVFAGRQERVMFLKGDPQLTFDQVAEVIDMGRRAGVEEIAMMTPGSEAGRR